MGANEREPRQQLRKAFLGLRTRAQLASLLEVSEQELCYVAWGMQDAEKYRDFEIRKRRGGVRKISAPASGMLRAIQYALKKYLEACYEPPLSAHGYIRGRSIKTNAQPHEGCETMLKLDLKDFFPSITDKRVYGLLRARPFSFRTDIAATLTAIICHGGHLPQGACTSPVVSNLMCAGLDKDLGDLARINRVKYTRYADDITLSYFSSDHPFVIKTEGKKLVRPIVSVSDLIAMHGFALNPHKVRFLNKYCRRITTGVVTNIRLNVPQSFIRETNRILKLAGRHGVSKVAEWYFAARAPNSATDRFFDTMRGRIEYARMIRGKEDAICSRHSQYLNNLIHGRPLTHAIQMKKLLRSVTILHVSDFHFRDKTQWSAEPILEKLLDRLRERRESGVRVDLIAVTGDIAYSGKASEYAIARQFFMRLCDETGVDLSKLLIVPGNHDVCRDDVGPTARMIHENLLKQQDPGQMIEDFKRDGQWATLLRPLSNYVEFLKSMPGLSYAAEPWWSKQFDFDGTIVWVGGLCSSWMSKSDGEQGQLLLGAGSTHSVVPHPSAAIDIKIALLHHPLSWIRAEDSESKETIKSAFDVVLHGHTHEKELSQTKSSSGSLATICAGSCYAGGAYANSFQFIEMIPSDKSSTASVFKWVKHERSWKEDRDLGTDGKYVVRWDKG